MVFLCSDLTYSLSAFGKSHRLRVQDSDRALTGVVIEVFEDRSGCLELFRPLPFGIIVPVSSALRLESCDDDRLRTDPSDCLPPKDVVIRVVRDGPQISNAFGLCWASHLIAEATFCMQVFSVLCDCDSDFVDASVCV